MKIIKNNFVVVHQDVANDALRYAKNNCPTYITNTCHLDEDNVYQYEYYNFYFMDNEQGKKEMVFFALKWT
jgi:hypothetical protein